MPPELVLLGSGELGKEVVIEAQRLGLEVIAVDHYANAPRDARWRTARTSSICSTVNSLHGSLMPNGPT